MNILKFKIRSLLLVVFFGLLVFQFREFGCYALDNKASTISQELQAKEPNAFQPGERIRFGVYSTAIKVGSGELLYEGPVAKDGELLQHVVFKVSTISVRDEDSVFGTLDFARPLRVERSIRIFGKDELIVEKYAQDGRSVLISKSINGAGPVDQTIASREELGNILLLIYKLRNTTGLRDGGPFKIVLPTQTFELYVKNVKKIKTPLGLFDAIYLESRPAKYRIWLSDTPDRLPLRIQGLVAGGMVYMVATNVSNPR